MEVDGSHYLGTFILAEPKSKEAYQVVDGQQRLTTLTMLLDALVDALDDEKAKIVYESKYLDEFGKGRKFTVLGQNQDFFTDLLSEKQVNPGSEGQRRMQGAYKWIRQRVANLKAQGGSSVIEHWLKTIGDLDVLEFITENEGKAIRMFQSVNDRGVPLSKMDIAKSLLIYYSNRFLNGELDEFVAEKFSTAFRDYSAIRDLASKEGCFNVKNIKRGVFSEDDILRYHYLAFDAGDFGPFDWAATPDTVLDDFLKKGLKKLSTDTDKLKHFISIYVTDLAAFFNTLRALLEGARSNKALYLLFVVGDLSATLYPLTIRLAQRNLLDFKPEGGAVTLLEMIDIVDVRVFKLWGTNPQADIYRLTHESAGLPPEEIATKLRLFVEDFMPDATMTKKMVDSDLYRNPVLPRIFSTLEEELRGHLPLDELIGLVREGQTIEHIFPQEPTFGVVAYGFQSNEDYKANIHRLGNLTLLESKLNSKCNNQSVEKKISGDDLYKDSAYHMTVAIAASHVARPTAFCLADINSRGEELAKRCIALWPLW